MSTTVPEIPGIKVPDGEQLEHLREHVRNLCHFSSYKYVTELFSKLTILRFPGAQPVSFTKQSLNRLLTEEYVRIWPLTSQFLGLRKIRWSAGSSIDCRSSCHLPAGSVSDRSEEQLPSDS